MMQSILARIILCVILSIEVINSKKLNRADYDLTTIQLIEKEGYKAEEHEIVTEDGYILILHRIPGKSGSPPVFLQHGLAVSSFEWLLSGRENSLGFYLADKGYDVWMGNSRGNVYSRRHVEYDPSEYRFWNFSWHEMGIYDVPAAIDYITTIKNESLMYISHSLGATLFFVMASEKPEMTTKVKVMFALSPVAFLDHSTSVLFVLQPIADLLNMILKFFHIYEVVPPDLKRIIHTVMDDICMQEDEDEKRFSIDNECSKLLYKVGGYNPSRFNYSVLPLLLNSGSPRGSSLKSFMHFIQVSSSRRFRQFDYGPVDNVKIYNQSEPPDYNLSRTQVPIGLIWGEADYYTRPEDVMKLYELLPKKLFNYKIPDSKFGHLDFLASLDAAKYIHSKLVSVMDKYRQTKIIDDIK